MFHAFYVLCEWKDRKCIRIQRENIIPAKKYIFKIIVPDRFKAVDPKKRHADLSQLFIPRESWRDSHYSLQDLTTLSSSLSPFFSFIFCHCRVARFVKLVCVNNCPFSSRISIRTPLPSEPSAFRRSGNYFIFSAEPARPLNVPLLLLLSSSLSLDRTFIFSPISDRQFLQGSQGGHRKIF